MLNKKNVDSLFFFEVFTAFVFMHDCLSSPTSSLWQPSSKLALWSALLTESGPESLLGGSGCAAGGGLLPGPSRRLAPVIKCNAFLCFQSYIVRDMSLTEIYRWLVTFIEILSSILKSTRYGGESRERL